MNRFFKGLLFSLIATTSMMHVNAMKRANDGIKNQQLTSQERRQAQQNQLLNPQIQLHGIIELACCMHNNQIPCDIESLIVRLIILVQIDYCFDETLDLVGSSHFGDSLLKICNHLLALDETMQFREKVFLVPSDQMIGTLLDAYLTKHKRPLSEIMDIREEYYVNKFSVLKYLATIDITNAKNKPASVGKAVTIILAAAGDKAQQLLKPNKYTLELLSAIQNGNKSFVEACFTAPNVNMRALFMNQDKIDGEMVNRLREVLYNCVTSGKFSFDIVTRIFKFLGGNAQGFVMKKTNLKHTLLHGAIDGGCIKTVQEILSVAGDRACELVNTPDGFGKSTLKLATEKFNRVQKAERKQAYRSIIDLLKKYMN